MEVDVYKEAESPADVKSRLHDRDLSNVTEVLSLVERMVADENIEDRPQYLYNEDEGLSPEEALRIERRRGRFLAQALAIAISSYNDEVEYGGCLQSELSQRLGELKELVDGRPEKEAI